MPKPTLFINYLILLVDISINVKFISTLAQMEFSSISPYVQTLGSPLISPKLTNCSLTSNQHSLKLTLISFPITDCSLFPQAENLTLDIRLLFLFHISNMTRS